MVDQDYCLTSAHTVKQVLASLVVLACVEPKQLSFTYDLLLSASDKSAFGFGLSSVTI
jgi:hypothetical protein